MVMDKGDKDLLKSIKSKEIFIIFYKRLRLEQKMIFF